MNVALSPRVMRPALIAIATAMLLLPALTPAPAGATASGPCSALGYESRLPASPAQMLAAGKEGRKDVTLTDLGFSSVWQVHPDSTLLVSGTAPITMHAANASVTLFGVPVPVYEATGASATGYVGDIEMRQLAPFLRTLGLEARAGPCSGAVVLAVQENPLLTVAGGGGVLLGFIGIVGLVRVALRRRRPGVGRRVGALALGILFGGMAGLGEGLWVQQAGAISPLDPRSLAVPAAGLLLGVLAGLLGGLRRRPAAAPAAPAPAIPGYRVLGLIGRGSTGTVYLARQEALGRRVAIKRLAPELAKDPEWVKRFRAEASLQARLDHPNCARVYGFLEHGGEAYLVTEFIEGASLRVVLRGSDRLSPEQALEVLRGALEGLGEAHALGLVHRDVKPENVIIDREGVSRLVDFGLALPAAEAPGKLTSGGSIAYMSPEQLGGGAVDGRSDLYSAGAVLFELLTGRPPYAAADPLAMLRMHLQEPVPDPRTFAPRVPAAVAEMVRRALAKDPAERPQTARDFVAELTSAAAAGYGSDWRSRASLAGVAGAALGAAGVAGLVVSGAGTGAATAGSTVSAATVAAGQVVVVESGATAGAATAGTGATAATASGGAGGIGTLISKVPTQLIAGATAAAVATAAPAVPIGPRPSNDVISPAQAVEVTTAAWRAAQAGFRADDPAAASFLAAFSGQGLATMESNVRTASLPNEPGRFKLLSRDLQLLRVFVPHQDHYPARFLAYAVIDVSVGSTRGVQYVLLTFIRTGAADTWRAVAISFQRSDRSLPRIALDKDGYAPLPTSTDLKKLSMPPSEVAAKYAGYLNAGLAAGGPAASSQFAPGAGTTEFIQDRLRYLHDQAVEVPTTINFAGGDAMSVFLLGDGSALVVFALDWREHFTVPAPACELWINQPPYSPGLWESANRDNSWVATALVPLRGGDDRPRAVTILSANGEAVHEDHVPCRYAYRYQ